MEDEILSVIESWGFEVEKINESNRQKTPDFYVSDEDSAYLIELKEKGDNPDQIANIDSKISSGEVHMQSITLKPTNKIGRVIEKAKSQLKSGAEGEDIFRLVWLAAVERDQEAKFEQFISTLFGTKNVVDIHPDGASKICYFFRNSAFYQYREHLDAAIVSWQNNAQLCINPYSPRYDRFRESKLSRFFLSENAFLDPKLEEEKGCGYIVDTSISRENEQDVLDFLCAKYGVEKLVSMDMGMHSAIMAIPDEET